MRHLYSSVVRVYELTQTRTSGAANYSWAQVTEMLDPWWGVEGELKCRLDLMFQRPGKDAPMPIQAGRAPDRLGVLFCDVTPYLKAGQRLLCIEGPVIGTFEIKAVPDVAQGFNWGHHIEVQVQETSQDLVGLFPGSEPDVN